jgi:hypothetical protein
VNFKFRLTDLLRFTAYFAVEAWLISKGNWAGGVIWFGTFFGFEIGKRSDYSTVLISLCGSVFGLTLWIAFVITRASPFFRAPMFGRLDFLNLILAALTWILAIAIFVWLWTRVRKAP